MNDAPGPLRGDADAALREDVAVLGLRVAELERQLASLQSLQHSIPHDTAAVAPPPPVSPLAPPGTFPAAEQPSASAEPPLAVASPPNTRRGRLPQTPRARADLESRIGSQVFNRVGIVALLLAATWFLKLAIASGWIGPTGRVLVGLIAGAALVLWSERFRRKGFSVFSYSLKAIGSGVLYLALWAAFQLYHLLPAGVALAAMLLVTAWNGWMAWSQNAELLGGFALAGALATPKLLSTGGDHEIFLFTYLLAADLLCVLLVRLKGWVRLLPWVFLSTVGYFIGWFTSFYTASALTLTAFFIVLLFAVFQLPIFVSSPVTQEPSGELPPKRIGQRLDWSSLTTVLLPLADAAFLSLAMYSALENAHHHGWLAWLMVCLAALYLLLMRLPQPIVTAGVHLSLAVVFLTVAIPLKATGEWITVAWLIEGVALLAVSLRRVDQANGIHFRLLRTLAAAALLLGWATAMVRASFDAAPQAFGNARFATACAGLAALAAATLLCRRHKSDLGRSELWPTLKSIAAAAIIAFNILAITAVVREIGTVWNHDLAGNPDAAFKRSLAISAFLMVYGAALLAGGFWQRSAFLRWQGLLLVALTIVKIFLWDTRNLGQGYRIASFLGLGVLLMAISFVYQKDLLSLRAHDEAAALDPFAKAGQPHGDEPA